MSTTKKKTAAPKKARVPKSSTGPWGINLANENADSLPAALGIKGARANEIGALVKKMITDGGGGVKTSTLMHQLGEQMADRNEMAFSIFTLGHMSAEGPNPEAALTSLLASKGDESADDDLSGFDCGEDDDEEADL